MLCVGSVVPLAGISLIVGAGQTMAVLLYADKVGARAVIYGLGGTG